MTDGMKFICKKCGETFPEMPTGHGNFFIRIAGRKQPPPQMCDGEIVPILKEGWSKPSRPIKDRSGHARWAHYFVDGKSLCGRWRVRKDDPPLFAENDLSSFGHCVTCRNKQMKRVSKNYENGWALPSNEEWYHYFYDGLSLCSRFMQHRDGQAEAEGIRCPHCEPQVKQFGGQVNETRLCP